MSHRRAWHFQLPTLSRNMPSIDGGCYTAALGWHDIPVSFSIAHTQAGLEIELLHLISPVTLTSPAPHLLAGAGTMSDCLSPVVIVGTEYAEPPPAPAGE